MPSRPEGRPGRRAGRAAVRRAATVLTVVVALGGAAAAAPAAAQLPPPTAEPDEVRRQAAEIVSGPQYQVRPRSALDHVQDWLSDRLNDLLGRGGAVPSAVAWLVLAALVGAVAFATYRFARGVRPAARHGIDVVVDVHRDADEWRADAVRLEARGEWKLALRARYRALVGDLVRADVVPDVPGRTTGEHRGDVQAGAPGAAGAFAGASLLFEEAWYGDRPTGAAENARFRSLADEVLSSAGGR